MKEKLTPIKLGNLTLKNRVFYSPLAGCSDYPFRKISSKGRRPGLFFCEMVKMEPLVLGEPTTFHLLDYSEDMHPIGAQLCGSSRSLAGQAAKIIEDLGFDLVDLNCGCPVDKVTKDGSGSGLLKNPELIGDLLQEIVKAVKIPVTVKIRIGWDEESINAKEITKIAEQAGAKAISIHGRTRKQAYKGPARWDPIRECKEIAKEIMVIGNGDVFSKEAAEKMFLETNCDAVLVSRGTFGKPWIADEILTYLEGKEEKIRTIEDYREALKEHFSYVLEYQSDQKAIIDMRRVGCWYIRNASHASEFRQKISRAVSTKEIQEIIHTFPFS